MLVHGLPTVGVCINPIAIMALKATWTSWAWAATYGQLNVQGLSLFWDHADLNTLYCHLGPWYHMDLYCCPGTISGSMVQLNHCLC